MLTAREKKKGLKRFCVILKRTPEDGRPCQGQTLYRAMLVNRTLNLSSRPRTDRVKFSPESNEFFLVLCYTFSPIFMLIKPVDNPVNS